MKRDFCQYWTFTCPGAAQVTAASVAFSKLHKFQNKADDSDGRYEPDRFRCLSSHESWLLNGFDASVNIHSVRFLKFVFENHQTGAFNGSNVPK